MSTAIMKPEIEARHITPLSLIQDALTAKVAPEVLKELVSLQQSMVRFEWEAQERQSKIDFDNALNTCQKRIGRIAPNVHRQDTRSWWADYAQLDRTIRPIYTDAGFSISYSEVQPISAGKVRIQGTLRRAGIQAEFFSEITPSTTGPKGNVMATATDADAIAMARAKRYILLDIFNISVGIDKEEKAGVPVQVSEEAEVKLQEWADALRQCDDLATLKNVFGDAWKFAKSIGPDQKRHMEEVYEQVKRSL